MKPILRVVLVFAVLMSTCNNKKTDLLTTAETDAEAFKKVEQVVQGVFDDVWSAY